MTNASTGPVRIGNMSGFYGDRAAAMREMLTDGQLDYLTGDYLAELTMLILARSQMKDPSAGYASTFLRQVGDNLELLAERRVKLVANAGGLNPAGLAEALRALITQRGLDLRVAHVEGDNLLPRADELGFSGALAANAYLGAWGIVECLAAGADIVVTGRVTDASVIVAPAAYHFGWSRDDVDAIAGAMAAGHVIECGTQATGGNYAFFNRPTEIASLVHAGFPIAEIDARGNSVITKHDGTQGAVTVGTVTSQLLYEVSGARYAGPDAILLLDHVQLTQEGRDRVRMSGARGEAPPPQVKVSINRLGGFRNEITLYLTGLDIEDKATLLRAQFDAIRPAPAQMDLRLERTDHPDADTQVAASARFTAVAWDRDKAVADNFARAAVEFGLGTCPGVFFHAPPPASSPWGVFVPGYVPQEVPEHVAVLADGTRIPIPAPEVTQPIGSSETSLPLPTHSSLGERPTVRAPLGRIAGARSGDKGPDANIGVWVEDDAAYAWLLNTLTVPELKRLLPETSELPVERFEFPHLRAVNFVIHGLLGHGVAHGARFDPQAKGLGEWLRSRHVEIPTDLFASGALPAQGATDTTPTESEPRR
ncbi:acyclic terpene utilization AtuA family protein [Gephyromycinifex aptenodytis]|uniref:acyclic terpene utilization AtuA family protein n=1 Tax=Gephyromycinifex aptenodytis TaxID=2716227 RepID=UPI001447C101|nr:acyclic terpene utilization AtuA family protein [Gephyromycinifex aptenodytis]